MNVQDHIGAPRPDLFAPEPRHRLNWKAIGLSRLAAKIIVLKLVGLGVLLIATLHQANLRENMADAVLSGVLVQTDALVASLQGGPDLDAPLVRLSAPTINPLQPDSPPVPTTVLDRDAVDRLFAALLEGSGSRAQLYGIDGERLADSRFALKTAGDVTQAPLPPLTGAPPSLFGRAWQWVVGPDDPFGPSGEGVVSLSEVAAAIDGVKTAERRMDAAGDIVLSVAAPVFDPRGEISGAIRVVSGPGAITGMAKLQEYAIIRGFAVASLIAVVLSLVLAASINRPLIRIADAAERIKNGGASPPIPELAEPGAIGELSRVLHDMTIALYSRMDAIEAFAGEVAHELKNPLTSLRSAVETLPLARTDRVREQLLDVIHHDVRRIDRLISDISDASRLDAELSRARHERFDLVRLLRTVVSTQAELAADRQQTVLLHLRSPGHAFAVAGNDSRLGQVFTNLIDNARSFTPDAGRVVVTAQRFQNFIEVVVDDEGPGMDESVMERIFERFYTDRPGTQSFGNNSGLGLAISRQIVEAHHGEIFAENRYRTTLTPERDIAGARFTVRLPVAR